MKKYSQKYINSLKQDRKNGASIHSLMIKYNMPKTSVWHHIKNIKLSKHHKSILRSNQGGSKIRKKEDLNKASVEARKLLKNVNILNVAPVILASLYWGEGNKRSFVFTNTDEKMLQLFLKILKRYWGIDNRRIQLLIRVTDKMNKGSCIEHWTKVTKIPVKNIKIDVNSKQNKSKTKYGICRVTIRKGSYGLKLTHAVINEIIARMH